MRPIFHPSLIYFSAGSSPTSTSKHYSFLQIQRLGITPTLQTPHTKFKPNTALLVAAEGSAWIELEVRIDPHVAGLQFGGQLVGALDIARPHGCAEAQIGVVGARDGFFIGGELEEWDDWAYVGRQSAMTVLIRTPGRAGGRGEMRCCP